MEWEKLIKELIKHPDKLIGFLIFLAVMIGPVIKKIFDEKAKKSRGAAPPVPRPSEPEREFFPKEEQAEEPEWGGEEREDREEAEEEPAVSLPEEYPKPIPVPQPPPVYAQAAIPPRRVESVEEEAASVSREAELVGTSTFQEESPIQVVEEKRQRDPFEGWSPIEIALVLGGSFDRPLALQEPGSSGPVGLRC